MGFALIFDDVIVLSNKSITTNGFLVSVMNSSLNDYRNSLLNCVGSLLLSKFTSHPTEMTDD